jgi:hypothetical protein
VLAAVFLKGFKEAIGVAAVAALPYLALNLAVLGRGAWKVMTHPSLLSNWRSALARTISSVKIIFGERSGSGQAVSSA